MLGTSYHSGNHGRLAACAGKARRRPAASVMGRLPLHFVPNRGQADPGIRNLANSPGLPLAFRDSGVEVADVRLRL